MEKVWFYERLFFEVVIFMTKDKKKKKKQYERCNVNKNHFYALHEGYKSNVNSSLREI